MGVQRDRLTLRVGGEVTVQNPQSRRREQVDADVDAALETLAPIPDVLTSTGNNAPGG